MSNQSRNANGVVALFAIGIIVLPVIGIFAWNSRDDDLGAAETPKFPLHTAATPRTVTDERQLRIVAEAVAGPEVAAGSARGTVTAVTAN